MAARSRIGDILIRAKLLNEAQLAAAISRQQQWGGTLVRSVVALGVAREGAVYAALALGLNLPLIDLTTAPLDAAALKKVPVELAEEKTIFPVALKDAGKQLVLAMADPGDLETVDQISRLSRTRVQPVVATGTHISQAILRHYRGLDAGLGAAAPVAPAVAEKLELTDVVARRFEEPSQAEAARQQESASSRQGTSTPDLLDELTRLPQRSFGPDELKRLEVLKASQQTCGQILRALQELLSEKGLSRQ